MIKNITMKRIFYIIFLVSIILSSSNVYAVAKVDSESGSITKGGVAQNYASRCKSYLGISIEASDYTRDTTITTNNVSSRYITIKCKGRCKYYMYVTDYGNLEKLGDSSVDDDEVDSDGDEFELPKPKTKTFTDCPKNSEDKCTSLELKPGKEALIIVVSLDKKKATVDDKGNKTTYPKIVQKHVNKGTTEKPNWVWEDVKVDCDPCLETDKDSGACKKYSKCTITCPQGNYKKADIENYGTEVDISGNGAGLFVQNPNDSGFVSNLRVRTNPDYGDACSDAWKGVHTKDDKFTITDPTERDTYQTSYYPKFMSYCDKEYFAFNLKSTQIEKMSNALLETYYYAKNISSDNYETVSGIINDLKNRIKAQYGSNHILTRARQLKNRGLQCDYSKERKTVDEYLYVKNGGTIKAHLSTGTVDVCTTQCYEHITVKYDEPKTVKAGLCFSYKVTVKSESDCAVKPLYDFSKVGQPTIPCSPLPICSNKSSHTQAGPNEDFDKCINSCDGGVYSQTCINSCYKKVYENKTKSASKTTKTSSNNNHTNATLLAKNDNKNNILRLKQAVKNTNAKYKESYDEDYLKTYYEEDNNDDCTTAQIIKYVHNGNNTMLKECADYFFQAKTLYPYGHYSGSSWKKDSHITDAGAKKEETTNIPMQVARSSPFYFRSIPETINTLKWLVVPANPSGTWRKYNIDEDGVKRQYSSRYKCDEECHFTGCPSGTAMSAKKYTETTTSDLNELANALSKCSVSSACDKKETETSFDITIKTKSETKPGGTAANKTRLNQSTPVDTSESGNSNIFIGEYKQIVTDPDSQAVEEIHYDVYQDGEIETTDYNTTGILGKCFNKGSIPHYQTTITYPGTYINYKDASREYTNPTSDSYYKKSSYFCPSYDDKDVNVKYWAWAEKENYDPNKYPEGFVPETDSEGNWNIKATLGKDDSGFGRYNWTFNFKCFYAEFNEIPTDDCPPTHPYYPTCKPPTTDNECDSEDSSRFCNLTFRTIDSRNVFPTKTGGNDTNRKAGTTIAFNWTEDATDKNLNNGGAELFKYGYGVNPADYREQLEAESENYEPFSGHIAYEVFLDKDAIRELKDYVKTNSYTKFYTDDTSTSRYRTIGNTELRYYTMSEKVSQYLVVDDGKPGYRCSYGSCQ